MNFIRNFLAVSMVVLFAMPMPSFANAAAGASVMIHQMNNSSRHYDYNSIPKRWKTGECPDRFHKVGNYCVLDQ